MRTFKQRPWLILFLPFAISLFFIRDRLTHIFEDSASYILLARALVNGQGYVSTWLEGSPGHMPFPPLVPFLLVPIRLIFGDHLWPAGLLMSIFYLGGALIGYRLLKNRVAPITAAVWTCFIVTSPIYLEHVISANSDLPYIFFSLGALSLLEERENLSKRSLAGALILGALAYYSRTIGFMIFATIPLFILLKAGPVKNRWITAIATGIIGILLMMPWFAWSHYYSTGMSYSKQYYICAGGPTNSIWYLMGQIARTVFRNIVFYFSELGSLVTYEMLTVKRLAPPLALVGTLIILALALTGWWLWLKRRRSAFPIYMFLYFVPVMVWFWQFNRYWFAHLILAGICMAYALVAISDKYLGSEARPRVEKLMVYAGVILTLGNVVGIIHDTRMPHPPEMTHFFEIHDTLKKEASPNDVVVSRNPSITGLLTGFKTRFMANAQRQEKVVRIVDGAQWVIVSETDPKARVSLLALIEKFPDCFQLTASVGETRLYRILKKPDAPEAPDLFLDTPW